MRVFWGATVRLEHPPLLLGEVVDLSLHGLGLAVARAVLPGARVEVAFDQTALPLEGMADLPPLQATVLSSRRVDEEGFRLGLVVDRMPDPLVEYVRDVATPTQIVVVDEAAVSTGSGPQREALYQAAWSRLGLRHYEAARTAALRALAADPANRLYRALAHLTCGEAFLARGYAGDALWELMKAHAHAPREPRISSLLARLRS